MKNIILCADDYGQDESISVAIIDLLQKKHLSATSCLTTSVFWPVYASKLKNINWQPDVGLHFNLTEGKPLSSTLLKETNGSFLSVGQLLWRSYFKRLPFNAIFDELNAQIDAFEAHLGYLPQYLDGHQHVHQFPLISDIVFKVYEKRLKHIPGFYMRCIYQPRVMWNLSQEAYLKKCILQISGASSFKKQLLQRKIAHNSSFSGIYDFQNSNVYPDLFAQFLNKIDNKGLIMCHPGLNNTSMEDPIHYSRQNEYQYLKSTAFLETCVKQGVSIKCFAECV